MTPVDQDGERAEGQGQHVAQLLPFAQDTSTILPPPDAPGTAAPTARRPGGRIQAVWNRGIQLFARFTFLAAPVSLLKVFYFYYLLCTKHLPLLVEFLHLWNKVKVGIEPGVPNPIRTRAGRGSRASPVGTAAPVAPVTAGARLLSGQRGVR